MSQFSKMIIAELLEAYVKIKRLDAEPRRRRRWRCWGEPRRCWSRTEVVHLGGSKERVLAQQVQEEGSGSADPGASDSTSLPADPDTGKGVTGQHTAMGSQGLFTKKKKRRKEKEN